MDLKFRIVRVDPTSGWYPIEDHLVGEIVTKAAPVYWYNFRSEVIKFMREHPPESWLTEKAMGKYGKNSACVGSSVEMVYDPDDNY